MTPIAAIAAESEYLGVTVLRSPSIAAPTLAALLILCVLVLTACRARESEPAAATPVQCPSDAICQFKPTVQYGDRFAPSAIGVVRPVVLRIVSLWRFAADEGAAGAWKAEPVAAAPTVKISAGHGATLDEVAGRPLPPALYHVALEANGRRQCLSIRTGRAHCIDVRIGAAPPGMRATCVPLGERAARAMFVPDPAQLSAGSCGDGGYVSSVIPTRNGKPNGLARSYLEDGRVLAETPYVDGVQEGLQIQQRNSFDGEQQHVETPFRHGVIEGVVRNYSRDGRLDGEAAFEAGVRHGLQRQYLRSGRVGEEWTWNRDRVTSIRVFDEEHHVVAQQDFGGDGSAHGTFCRPDHHCSEW